jgi:hypothetical protein
MKVLRIKPLHSRPSFRLSPASVRVFASPHPLLTTIRDQDHMHGRVRVTCGNASIGMQPSIA